MGTSEEMNATILQVLHQEPRQKLTATDLQILRANADLLEGHDRKTDYFQFRMEIELIDTIRSLDEVSGKLITTTNRLTWAILGLTFIGVVLAVVQIVLAVRTSH